jgi:hypothetical protein
MPTPVPPGPPLPSYYRKGSVRGGGGYTVVTLLLHCCYTVATLLLHCCYTVVTLLSHCCYTVVTLLLHCCYTVVTLLLHCCYTVVILPSHYRVGGGGVRGGDRLTGRTQQANTHTHIHKHTHTRTYILTHTSTHSTHTHTHTHTHAHDRRWHQWRAPASTSTLLHCCYTVVTLLLHYCYTVVICNTVGICRYVLGWWGLYRTLIQHHCNTTVAPL